MGSKVLTREDAWIFIDQYRDNPIKLRINLLDEAEEEFYYVDGEPILMEGNLFNMFELIEQYRDILPSITDLINITMQDVASPERFSDENIVEELMGNVDVELENAGYRGEELDEMVDILNDLVRDFYNYVGFALVETRLVNDEKMWEFLKCTKAHFDSGKLYITAILYVDELKDLDLMDERSDVDFVEVVDEMRKLLGASTERALERLIKSGDRSNGSLQRLLS